MARGWLIIGTSFDGDCGAVHEFTCTDTHTLSNDTLFGDLIIHAQDQVNVDSIIIDTSTNILISAPEVNLGDDFSSELNAELKILQ